MPFDWVVSSVDTLERCLEDNFNQHHCNLVLNEAKTRLIDSYGFEFPHDYPLTNTDVDHEQIGVGSIGEVSGKTIVENWHEYYPIAKEKYGRRIRRFLDIMNGKEPVVIGTKYSEREFVKLQCLLLRYPCQKVFVNAFTEDYDCEDIICFHSEKNGVWNDTDLWSTAIQKALQLIPTQQ